MHPTNDFGFCDTDTSLSSVVSTSRTEKSVEVENDTQTTDLTLKIETNEIELDKVYSLSNGESEVVLCVRA